MSAKSILSSGNTYILNAIVEGLAPLTVSTLTVGSSLTGTQVELSCTEDGVLTVGGSVAPSDIMDNSGSIGTPDQILVKASTGTDMIWSSDISPTTVTASGDISCADFITSGTITSGGNIDAGANLIETTGDINAGNIVATGDITATGSISAAGAITSVTDITATAIINAGGDIIGGGTLTVTGAVAGASFRGGLLDSNGSSGTNGQYPVANGAGGWVWTDPA
jgi:filamentous hemagglutinin